MRPGRGWVPSSGSGGYLSQALQKPGRKADPSKPFSRYGGELSHHKKPAADGPDAELLATIEWFRAHYDDPITVMKNMIAYLEKQ